MRGFLLISGLALVGLSGLAQAAPSCEDAITQQEMNACAGEGYQAADEELNATYDEVMGRLDGDSEEGLKTAQRAWIQFRDAECDFVSGPTSEGSANSMVKAGCLEKLTHQRTEALKSYSQCEEGDVSCPVPRQ
ncbi:lysozyme inhibitor LprI family protein [Salinicola corii]|uniref:Lysozyme inhibitor LprI family protein n=1 Tax=Salinicola corii TaxID=2606937 RepID=A0A640W928_9GAMM|nr:lysozyme inhibitor LprI family protein [Salinicola corii]KAA0016281.1 lysozyme inhibitor LprI family protein [Salinicola corii]